LSALFTAAGIDLEDYELPSVIDVSADGKTILGTAVAPYHGAILAHGWYTPRTAVWIAHLPSVPQVVEADVPSAYEHVPGSDANSAPVLGKKKAIVRKSRLFVAGSARGDVTSVEYRVGNGAFQTATGTNLYRFQANLKPGRNLVTIRATGPGGTSDSVTFTATRR
jgi:hypothetical protein